MALASAHLPLLAAKEASLAAIGPMRVRQDCLATSFVHWAYAAAAAAVLVALIQAAHASAPAGGVATTGGVLAGGVGAGVPEGSGVVVGSCGFTGVVAGCAGAVGVGVGERVEAGRVVFAGLFVELAGLLLSRSSLGAGVSGSTVVGSGPLPELALTSVDPAGCSAGGCNATGAASGVL